MLNDIKISFVMIINNIAKIQETIREKRIVSRYIWMYCKLQYSTRINFHYPAKVRAKRSFNCTIFI